MFFAESEDQLPHPRCIGDILYLRRFSFEKWNDQFQAKVCFKSISSWALLCGDSTNGFNDYQKSKLDMHLEDSKFDNIRQPLREIRIFGRKYLENHSIIKSLKPGVTTKDDDYIVQLVRRLENGSLIVNNGEKEWVLNETPSAMQENEIGKLRSVAQIRKEDAELVVCRNNFTSLTKLPEWSFDAQSFIKRGNAIDEEDEEIYKPLNELLIGSAKELDGKVFNVKCEVFRVSPDNFKHAVQHYDSSKNALSDNAKKGHNPVYKIELLCSDSSLPEKKAVDFHVFSIDGKCSNFVPNVDLSKDWSELSSFVQEEELFQQRYDELLEAEAVKMTVECRVDAKGNKLFRVIRI